MTTCKPASDTCGAKYTCSSNTVDKCSKGIADHVTCGSGFSCLCDGSVVVVNCSACDKTSDLNCNLSDKGKGCDCNAKCYNENCTGASCDAHQWLCQGADHTACSCHTVTYREPCKCETPFTCPCEGSRDTCYCDEECACDVGCNRAGDDCYQCYGSTYTKPCTCNTPGHTCYQCYGSTYNAVTCSCHTKSDNPAPPCGPSYGCSCYGTTIDNPPKPSGTTSTCSCQGASNSIKTSCGCNSKCYSESTSCNCDRKCYQFQACQTCDGCNQYQPCSCDAACNVESCAQCHSANYSQPW